MGEETEDKASRRRVFAPACIALFCQILAAAPACGQDAAPEPARRVVETSEVDLGPRSIIYRRVETPRLRPPAAEPAPAPDPDGATGSAEEPAEPVELMPLSATVYDGGEITEVRWFRPEGEHVFWVAANFHHLRGLREFVHGGTRYFFTMGIGDESREDARAWNARVDAAGLPAALKRPVPRLAEGETLAVVRAPAGAGPGAAAAMAGLLDYYRAHREELAAAWLRSQRAEAARLQYELEHPAQPKDTTVDFFPIRRAGAAVQPQGAAR